MMTGPFDEIPKFRRDAERVRAFSTWYFTLLERIVLVVAFGVAAQISGNWVLWVPTAAGSLLVGLWVTSSIVIGVGSVVKGRSRRAQLVAMGAAIVTMSALAIYAGAVTGNLASDALRSRGQTMHSEQTATKICKTACKTVR